MASLPRPDRRRFPRIPVSLSIVGHIDDHPHPCRARELSEGALIVEGLERDLAEGTFIQLDLFIPGSAEPVWAVAESAPIAEGSRQLLSFCILPESDRDALRAFVARRRSPRSAERVWQSGVEIVRPEALSIASAV